jgi:formylglycine-generating enzyme required for sulfatase activity
MVLDWHQSPAHLLLLSSFLRPHAVDDLPPDVDWQHELGEEPAQAVEQFLDEGLVVSLIPVGSLERGAGPEALVCSDAGRSLAEAFLAGWTTAKREQLPPEMARKVLAWIGAIGLGVLGNLATDALKALVGAPRAVPPAAGLATTPAPAAQPVPTPAPMLSETRPPVTVRTPEPGQVQPATWQGPIHFDWVTIPAGSFLMGSNPRRDKDALEDEQPQHRVYLPEYCIARVPVTLKQFVDFVEATDYRTEAERADSEFTWYQPRGRGSDARGKAQHPVTWISWRDAQEFCRWAKVCLPSEAEWEKAARGTDGKIYPWGNQPPPTAQLCNSSNWVGDTTPVGRYPKGASPFGVLDMAGNVWEWTSTLYSPYPYKANDGREDAGSALRRVLRGGSYDLNAGNVRCAVRYWDLPDSRNGGIGFRVVVAPIRL